MYEEVIMKKRLVTRSDFDGLVCAMLLKEMDIIGDIKFVHPKDVQDGKVELSENDITTNLPFDKRVGLAFDHHESELLRNKEEDYRGKYIIEGDAKSAARVVYNYYGGAKTFTRVSDEIMWAVDKGDSADFTKDEILNPTGWVLMNFLMDARTGLKLPDVKERVDMYFEQQEKFVEQLKRITRIEDKVAVIDLRNEETIYTGNRFMVYALWPEVEISIHVAWGFRKQNTAVMIGKSIINKVSNFNIGELCLSYGGGGHANAGTCQLDNDKIDAELPVIIDKINKGA